jgi:hypothetical protein
MPSFGDPERAACYNLLSGIISEIVGKESVRREISRQEQYLSRKESTSPVGGISSIHVGYRVPWSQIFGLILTHSPPIEYTPCEFFDSDTLVCFRAFENRRIHGGPITGFATHRTHALEVITSMATLQTMEKRDDFCANGRVFVGRTDTFGTFFLRRGKSKPLPVQRKRRNARASRPNPRRTDMSRRLIRTDGAHSAAMPQNLRAEFGKCFTLIDKPRLPLLTDCAFICMSTPKKDREPVDDKLISRVESDSFTQRLKRPCSDERAGGGNFYHRHCTADKRQGKKAGQHEGPAKLEASGKMTSTPSVPSSVHVHGDADV